MVRVATTMMQLSPMGAGAAEDGGAAVVAGAAVSWDSGGLGQRCQNKVGQCWDSGGLGCCTLPPSAIYMQHNSKVR
ncbi:hypothetical protein DM860_016502 [Cuscuta australis]|uniref:Uncharacterized protein n=1 Tax=Cuscuta australis TaxID=267555 RepID=A0A328E1W9_9ASTE|nr:hypothetical protein DM860_016502 [Cuscuta australis]